MKPLLLGAKNSGGFQLRNLVNGSTTPINIGELIREKEREKKFYHSFELVSQAEDDQLYKRFFRDMKDEYSPLFFALTSHEKSVENSLPLQLLPEFPKNTLLHLSAKGLKHKDVEDILTRVSNIGITNLLVVRGDGPTTDGDFSYALDLIEFIKSRYENKFCIAVAGYPDTHPESPSRESDLYYLKKKVDAGASFIITQMIFDSQRFLEFFNACRSHGITIPIIPGILPISNYKTLMNLKRTCSLIIPQEIHQDLSKIKDNDEESITYGITLATKIANEILSSGVVHGCHFFTLNKISITQQICKNLISQIN